MDAIFGKTVVLCPSILVEYWDNKMARHFPEDIDVLLFYGTKGAEA